MTQVIQVDSEHPQVEAVARAASVIRRGGLVAFPTETVYGLGADAMSQRAIEKIFEAKGRPADNPLIVHVGNRDDLLRVAKDVSHKAWRLIERFWPGPLTLVLRRAQRVAPAVSAGLETVAVRMPNNSIAIELIKEAGTPVAAPSANISGRPSPTTAAHVLSDLEGRVDLILDGGATNIGIESTVLDMTTERAVILRPGWITREQIAEIAGEVGRAANQVELERSPGTRHRHYSPRARVVLVEEDSAESIIQLSKNYLERGPAGFIGHTPVEIDDQSFHSVILENSASDYAHSLYRALRQMDEQGAKVIIVEGIAEGAEGAAVMDRLRRAASEIL